MAVQLRKAMGFPDLVLFYVVTALSLRWIATAAAAGPSSLAIWVAGCILYFVPLTLCVLELSSRYPDEGGMYVWSKKAFGEFAGFMTGWMYWTANLPYYPGVLYFAAGNALFVGGDRWQHLSTSAGYFITASLIGLALGFALNVVGLNIGKWLHNLGALGTWLPAFLLIVMGLTAKYLFGSATDFGGGAMVPSPDLKNVFFWSTVAFAFGGVEGASTMGDEIRDARRTVPRAILTAGAATTVLYIVCTFSLLVTLPREQVNGLQGISQALQTITARVGVAWLAPVFAAFVTLNALGGVGGRSEQMF